MLFFTLNLTSLIKQSGLGELIYGLRVGYGPTKDLDQLFGPLEGVFKTLLDMVPGPHPRGTRDWLP